MLRAMRAAQTESLCYSARKRAEANSATVYMDVFCAGRAKGGGVEVVSNRQDMPVPRKAPMSCAGGGDGSCGLLKFHTGKTACATAAAFGRDEFEVELRFGKAVEPPVPASGQAALHKKQQRGIAPALREGERDS
jgi:hypothetical protein